MRIVYCVEGAQPRTAFDVIRKLIACSAAAIVLVLASLLSTTPAVAADAVSLGCFRDDNVRDFIPLPAGGGGSMTNASCRAACAKEGYRYAGTQFGSQCNCDNSYPSYGESNACTSPCAGNASEICGGSFANTVWDLQAKAEQTINFTKPADTSFVANGTVPLKASATSGLKVSFASNSTGVCTVSGSDAVMKTTGTCSITASQAGDDKFAEATPVKQTFSITAPLLSTIVANSNITFPVGVTITPVAPVTASGGTTPYTYAISPKLPAGLLFNDSGQITGKPTTATPAAAYVVTVTDSTAPVQTSSKEFSLAVGKASQTIAFTDLADIGSFVPNQTVALTATASSKLEVTFGSATPTVCTVAGATATVVAAGTCTINANQAGDSNYDGAKQVSKSFGIGKAAQTIAFSSTPPSPASVGSTYTVSATGGASGKPISFAVTPTSAGVCAISGDVVTFSAAGTCTIAANQLGSDNYNAAPQLTQVVSVEQSASTIVLAASADATLLGQSVTFTATVAPSSATGTVSFSEGATTLCSAVPLSGSQAKCATSFTTAGVHSVVASYSGNVAIARSTSPAISVTVTDQTGQTVAAIGNFIGHRNNLLASNQPGTDRQIDRLMQQDGEGESGTGGTGFTDTTSATATDHAATASRFGAGQPEAALSGLLSLGSHSKSTRGSPFEDEGVLGPAEQTSGAAETAGQAPVNVTGSNVAGPMQLSFSTSLSTMMRLGAEAEQRRVNQAEKAVGGLGLAAKAPAGGKAKPSPFDIWIEGKYTSFSDGKGASDRDGYFGLVSVGADYVLSKSLLVGMLVQADSMHETDETKTSEIKGTGWMAGPYAAVRLSKDIFWQGRAAWGRSDNEVSPFGTYTDSFETSRWLFATSLSGRWSSGPWVFMPSVSVTYLEDTSEAYRDTFGVLIPEVESRLGQAKAGPKVGYSFDTGGVRIEPYAGLDLIWNFADELSASGLALGDDASGPDGVRGKAEIGLDASTADGLRVGLSGSYDGIGTSDYRAVTGRASLRVPLN